MRLEATIHPDFAQDFRFDDDRLDEPTDSVVVIPGEFVYMAIQQFFNGTLQDVAYIFFNFETTAKKEKVEYEATSIGVLRNLKNVKLNKSIKKGEVQYFVPESGEHIKLPPIILKLT